jgi:hypothetical protein
VLVQIANKMGLQGEKKISICRAFQKERYNRIPNVTVWRVLTKTFTLKDVQTIHH